MTDEVLLPVEGVVGRIRLNRPKAIHALNTSMCDAILAALVAWRNDDGVRLVTIDHAEGRGFCAGGDVVALAKSGAGDGVDARAFFFTEYRVNHALFTYPKPTLAFMDGIVMGGGVGLSQPCRWRVATENTRFAMPEATIGLFPDVGGGWYLSRLPGRIGQFLALTAERLHGADCVAVGLATHYIEAARLEETKARIAAAPTEAEAILAEMASPAPPSAFMAQTADIDRLFASDRLEDIIAALQDDGGEWAQKQLATLATKSPQTMKVSLRLLAEGAQTTDFADEMAREYAVASRIVVRPDFREGVRALLIDKDNAPHWDPATPEGVTDALLDAIFAPLPAGEAWTPAPSKEGQS